MKTADEILAVLEADLAEAKESYNKWKHISESEAFKHLIAIHVLEQALDEIDYEEEPEVAKVLAEMPEKPKPKRTLSYYFVHVLSAIAFIVSWFTIDGLIFDLVDKFNFLSGTASVLIHYGYLLIHFGAYLFLAAYLHNTND